MNLLQHEHNLSFKIRPHFGEASSSRQKLFFFLKRMAEKYKGAFTYFKIVTVIIFGSGWLVVYGLTPLWDIISVYIGLSPRERGKEKIGEKKMSKKKNTSTYCKRSRPLPYYNPNQ